MLSQNTLFPSIMAIFFFQLGFSARNRKTETAQGPLGKSGFNKGLSAYNIFNRLEEWESGGHPAHM